MVESPLDMLTPTEEVSPLEPNLPGESPAPQNLAPPKRRFNPLRPSLSRVRSSMGQDLPTGPSFSSVSRASSFNSISSLSSVPNVPAFTFNAEQQLLTESMSLGDCFASSPPQPEKRSATVIPETSALMPPPRPKTLFSSQSSIGRTNGPSFASVRRSNAPVSARPRKQFRRSLSMFENPSDVVEAEPDFKCPTLSSIMDIEESYVPKLPHAVPDPDSLPRISSETFIDVLDNKYQNHYDHVMVIDCRFEYEYEGGHIKGAVNYNNKEMLGQKLFSSPMPERSLLIFHCEYSAHRAPIMAKFTRHLDRTENAARYPYLTFPELYILDGGYSAFFSAHTHRCYPQNYVEMGAEEHALTCERELGKLKQRSKLARAQTYSMGQRPRNHLGSPTAGQRSVSASDDMLGGRSQSSTLDVFSSHRGHAKRMASY
jgi:M-phase inducer tyrosine phosphatase